MVENIKFYYYGAKYRKFFEPHDIPAWNAGEKNFEKKILKLFFVFQNIMSYYRDGVWERKKDYITHELQGWVGPKIRDFVLRNIEMTPN